MFLNEGKSGWQLINRVVLAFGAATGLVCSTAQAAGGLAGLYAEQPPAGSVFVRVLNPGAPVQMVWAGGKQVTLPQAGNLATAYKIVDPAKRPDLLINGKAVGLDKVALTATYATWVIQPGASDVAVVVDESPPANALKVVLRVTNLVPECQVALKTAEGAVVADGLPAWTSKARAINPVRATLVASCGATVSGPFVLPPLQAGDRFSVFVLGTPRSLVLSGQVDTTEAYSGKP